MVGTANIAGMILFYFVMKNIKTKTKNKDTFDVWFFIFLGFLRRLTMTLSFGPFLEEQTMMPGPKN